MITRIYIQVCHYMIFGLVFLSITSCFAQSSKTDTYSYIVETPETYANENERQFPLIIFLHGAGERGEDLSMLGIHGPLKLIQEGKKFEAIVFAPLCPKDVWWESDQLQLTLEEVTKKYRIDKSKIYLTGLSMGGYATWLWAGQKPDQFKRIAPICGGGNIKDAQRLSQVPTWAFHGGVDEVVPPSESQKMIDAIQRAGGNPKLTIYPKANHDSWTATYENEEFWKWFLQ